MSTSSQFFFLAAIEIGGLFLIWFLVKAKVKRYLELENLLSGVRDEARELILELNETADRNVSLVEDRMIALHSLLDEVDRRIGVQKREIEKGDAEREVYAKLNKRRPIVPEVHMRPQEPTPQTPPMQEAISHEKSQASNTVQRPPSDAPITLSLGSDAQGNRSFPDVWMADEPLSIAKSRREEALDLHRRGISADLIAARLGATVAEIELLVELEERRHANSGGSS
jgi:uncharacterized small protein (DUF1192 family)